MRIKIIAVLTFCYSFVQAQTFKYPLLNPQGKSIKTLTPSHWKVIDSVYGDLNNDNIEDLAVVYEFYAAVKENRAYGDNTTELITEIQKPRMLAIYFKSGKNYKLSKQNNDFLLRSQEGGVMGDPLKPLAVREGRLFLTFEGGGNWKWKLTYDFKFQNGDWWLARANNYAYHSESGEINDKMYDFIKKTKVTTTGNTNARENANKVTEQALSIKSLRNFSSFKKPWTWELGPDEYL